jgi:hypothetical protein
VNFCVVNASVFRGALHDVAGWCVGPDTPKHHSCEVSFRGLAIFSQSIPQAVLLSDKPLFAVMNV